MYDTQMDALRSVDRPKLADRCYNAIRAKLHGMSADEVAHELGETVLAIRPRITELKAAGKIAATDRRRRNSSGRKAVVWTTL